MIIIVVISVIAFWCYKNRPISGKELARRLDDLFAGRTPLIGCGTGASTLLLAQLLKKSHITAVDFLQDFLDVLKKKAESAGVAERKRKEIELYEKYKAHFSYGV